MVPAEPTKPTPIPTEPDAFGRAALLLVESLIHALKTKSVLTVAEAVAVVEIALEAQQALADDEDTPDPAMSQATAVLSSILASLSIDLPG